VTGVAAHAANMNATKALGRSSAVVSLAVGLLIMLLGYFVGIR
jgi:hypothetical protein